MFCPPSQPLPFLPYFPPPEHKEHEDDILVLQRPMKGMYLCRLRVHPAVSTQQKKGKMSTLVTLCLCTLQERVPKTVTTLVLSFEVDCKR